MGAFPDSGLKLPSLEKSSAMPVACRFRIVILFLCFAAATQTHAQQATTPQIEEPSPQRRETRPNPDANGIYHIGDGVTTPKLVYSVEPEFPEQARKRKISGNIMVKFIVEADGHLRDIQVIKFTGLPDKSQKDRDALHSLEPKAIEAVQGYRFEPATLHGKPVPCWMTVEVNFQIF
jgi:TonB family protein